MRIGLLMLLCMGACVGPDAPDGAICSDVAARLCAQAGCVAVGGAIPTSDCEAQLKTTAGCDIPGFEFPAPGRSRVLSCRLTLMRAQDDATLQCQAAADFLDACSDVAALYGVLR